MSLLELGTQDSVQDCYNSNGTMNQEKLREHLNDFGQKYSRHPNLVNDVKRMVEPEEVDRADGTSKMYYANPPQ